MTERANYLLYKIICLLFFSLGLLQILIKHLIVIVLIVTCQIQATYLSVRQSLYVISLKEWAVGVQDAHPATITRALWGPETQKI